MTVRPRVRIPSSAAVGETITIKTLITHPMESGQRRADDGSVIPRQIINRFLVEFEGETVFEVGIEPGVAANPYFEFDVAFPGPGTFRFVWTDDDGSVYETEEFVDAA